MNLFLAAILSFILPVVPWIGAAGSALKDRDSGLPWGGALGISLVLDLWWAKPIGATALGLVTLVLLLRLAQRLWPAERRLFAVFPSLLGIIFFEIYLRLI